jgi:hypothetical protein
MARPRHEALNNRKRLRLKRAGHPHRRRSEVRIPSAPPGSRRERPRVRDAHTIVSMASPFLTRFPGTGQANTFLRRGWHVRLPRDGIAPASLIAIDGTANVPNRPEAEGRRYRFNVANRRKAPLAHGGLGPLIGRKARPHGSPREGPGCGPKPPFRCEREIGFTAHNRDTPFGHIRKTIRLEAARIDRAASSNHSVFIDAKAASICFLNAAKSY